MAPASPSVLSHTAARIKDGFLSCATQYPISRFGGERETARYSGAYRWRS
jgi:hypothetical protein